MAVETLYDPVKKQKRIDQDDIPLEVEADYTAEIGSILDRVDDPKDVIDGKFLRCCADLLAIIDAERLVQGREPYTFVQRTILVYELFRSCAQYKGTYKETRKDGTNTFYCHLVGSIKHLVQDCGFTGIVPVLAMLKHDTVEDFLDKDCLKKNRVNAMREAVRSAIKYIAPEVVNKLNANIFAEAGIDISETPLEEAVPFPAEWEKVPAALKRLRAALEDLEDTKREVGDATDDISAKRVAVRVARVGKVLKEISVSAGAYAEDKNRNEQERALYDGLLHFEPIDFLVERYGKDDPISTRIIFEEVKALVKGMTKLKKADPNATSEEALRRLLTVAEHHPRVVVCKCCDRVHNTSSLRGHGEDHGGLEAQRRIMLETVEVHLQMAELYRIRQIVKKLVYHACSLFNPNVDRFFRNKSKKRLRERMDDSVRNGVLEKIEMMDGIAAVKFVPIDLDHYWDRIDKPIEDVDLDDVKVQIDHYDPMFEIVVIVKPEDEQVVIVGGETITYLQAKKRLSEAQTADNRAYFDYLSFEISKVGGNVMIGDVEDAKRRKGALKDASDATFRELTSAREILQRFSFDVMNRVAHGIAERFATHGSRTVITAPDKDDPDRALGFKFNVFNNDLGGRLNFRVNDETAEALSKRGELAYVDDNPSRIQEAIRALLRRQVAEETGVAGIREGAKQELFKKQIVVYTPTREPIHLFDGATGFDFAAAVHGDLLIGAQKIYKKDSVTKDAPEREIDLWEKLEDGKTYRVETCLPLEEKGARKPEKIIAHPLWLQFCGREAATYLRRYFREAERAKEGMNYRMGLELFAEIATMFSITGLDLMNLLLRRYGKKYSPKDDISRSNVVEVGRKILADIGNGEINLLSLLAQSACGSRKLLVKKYGEELAKITREPAVEAEDPARQRQVIALQKDISNTDIYVIEVKLSEECGSIAEFSREFSREAGIVIKHMEHEPGRLPELDGDGRVVRKGTKGRLIVTFDLKQAQISEYELFRKIFELQMKYQVRVVGDDADVRRKYISRMRQDIREGDFVLTDECTYVFDYAGSGYRDVLKRYRKSRRQVARRR